MTEANGKYGITLNMATQTRRNALIVIADILGCIARRGGHAKKSEVAQCSNLNTNVFNKYLGLLEQTGAVRIERSGRNIIIALTSHGVFLLALMRYIISLLYESNVKVVNLGLKLENTLNKLLEEKVAMHDDSLLHRVMDSLPVSNCKYYFCVTDNGFCCLKSVKENAESATITIACCRTPSFQCKTLDVKLESLDAAFNTHTLDKLGEIKSLVKSVCKPSLE